MESGEYGLMQRLEATHWWYVGLRELVYRSLVPAAARAAGEGMRPRLLDAGCGTGGLLAECGGFERHGFDLAPEAIQALRGRGLGHLVRASLRHLPYRDESFDAVTALDNLYYIPAAEETETLASLARLLKPGGRLVLNLPAIDLLKSSHDRAVHITRRYHARAFARRLREAGLEVKILTYRNSFLFPLAAGVRLFKRLWADPNAPPRSDLSLPPAWANRILLEILRLENRLIARGARFWIGLSLFAVAEREGGGAG